TWLPISYDWSFKLVFISWAVFAFSLFNLNKEQLTGRWKIIGRWLIGLSFVVILMALFLPTRYLQMIELFFMGLTGTALVFAIVSFVRVQAKGRTESILLSLSLLALMSNLMWMFYFRNSGVKIMYYPFDIIIALFCFASIWFRRSSRAHLEAERLAEKLQRQNQLKDEFLANTSHELRNPLHGILNILNSILEREQTNLGEKSSKDLQTVLSMGRHMSFTLNDLLDVMHLQEGKPRLHLKSISIQPIVTGIMDMLHFMIEGKQIRLTNNIPKEFPNVYADENREIGRAS